MRTRAIVLKEYKDKVAEQKGILEKGDALTADDVTRAQELETEIETLNTELEAIKSVQSLAAKNAERHSKMDEVVGRPSISGGGSDDPAPAVHNNKGGVPIAVSRARVRNFKGLTREEAARKAYRFGMFLHAALTGSEKSLGYCREHGIALKRQNEGDNSAGGYLVPEEFENDLIDLREEFGVFRRLARNVPMGSDTKRRPRRKGGLKAYPVGEGKAGQYSSKQWDNVLLTAKKSMVLAKISSELDEDSIINMGDDLAEEIAYAFAEFEDECGFLGDGSGDYMRIVGLNQAFRDVDPTPGNIKGLITASGDSWGEITLPDFNNLKGRLPRYARRRRNQLAWHTTQEFYSTVMERLLLAAGGVTAAELAAGRDQEEFMGYPVEINETMPTDSAANEIVCYFGNLSMAADFGDRRQTTIAVSDSVFFEEDEIGIRGTERVDINVHDVGDTAKPGPLVALRTAES